MIHTTTGPNKTLRMFEHLPLHSVQYVSGNMISFTNLHQSILSIREKRPTTNKQRLHIKHENEIPLVRNRYYR